MEAIDLAYNRLSGEPTKSPALMSCSYGDAPFASTLCEVLTTAMLHMLPGDRVTAYVGTLPPEYSNMTRCEARQPVSPCLMVSATQQNDHCILHPTTS